MDVDALVLDLLDAEPPSLVHIVVWWELCWYRYEVDLSDDDPIVQKAGQGYELSELAPEERCANALAADTGRVLMLQRAIVDDDPAQREFMQAVLRPAGHEVVLAEDGEAGVIDLG